MTGAAIVNSPHAFRSIRNLFVDKYLTPELGKLPSYSMKLAWQTLAMCRAALEIHHGEKMNGKQIHAKMWDKYVSWTKIICDEDDAGVKIGEKPNYLSEVYFLTSDAKNQRFYKKGAESGKRFWKKWGTVKSVILNSDNHIVKKTIASMPGGALPSGTDWSLFLNRLMYNVYTEKEKMKPKKDDEDDDEDNNGIHSIVEIGGSAAKKAGPSPYTENTEEKTDCDGNTSIDGSCNITDTVECVDTCGNDVSNDNNENNEIGGDEDDSAADNDDHDEPKAPDTFLPSSILIVLTLGVLSEDCDTLLNHVIDQGDVDKSNIVAVPNRMECRSSALKDMTSGTASLASATSSISNPVSSIDRLKAKASYNEAYKEANKQKNELGAKRLKIYEEEVDMKRIEVKARQDEVKARQDEVKARQDEVKIRGLEVLYNDLRQDLKDAREMGDSDEIKMIREEMKKVQKQRRSMTLPNL